MIDYVLLVAISVVAHVAGFGRRFSQQTARKHPRADLLVGMAAVALVGLFGWQLWLNAAVAAGQMPRYHFLDQVPIPVLSYVGAPPAPAPSTPSRLMELVVGGEGLALFGLWFIVARLRPTRRAAVAVAAAFVAMLALALGPHVLVSADMYAYAGDAKLGALAYTPPARPFGGSFAAVNVLWGLPIPPSPYGPLWETLSRAVVGRDATLGAALHHLQLLGALGFTALVALLWRFRLPAATLAIVALNPMLFAQFVADGHNDIWAIDLAVLAFLVVRRLPLLAVAAVAAAGLVKLPMLLLGLAAFGRLDPLRRRFVYGAAAIATCCLASLALGGHAYLTAMQSTAARQAAELYWVVVRSILAAVAVAAVGLAYLRRPIPPAIWSFPMLSANLYPWYFAWGVPYGLTATRMLPAYLCALPVAAYAVDASYVQYKVATLEGLVLAALLVLAVRRSMTKPRVALKAVA